MVDAREALALGSLPVGSVVKLTGDQELMGMEGKWELFFSTQGEFAQAYVGSRYSSVLAFDGETVWETDAAGRVSPLDMDDLEVSILASWLLYGFWSVESARRWLEIHSLTREDEAFLEKLPQEHRPFEGMENVEFLVASLVGKETAMYLFFDSASGLPLGAVVKAYGTSALVQLGEWTEVLPGYPLRIPMRSIFLRDSGDLVRTEVTQIELFHSEGVQDQVTRSLFPRLTLFQFPQEPILTVPLGTYPVAHLDPNASSEVEAYETPSGHVLIRPSINGQDVGYFILDTGASTLTIEPTVADALDMQQFGCVHTVTVNGPSQCSFREAASFVLGPLSIQHPRFVDVPGAALAERDRPVAGICGFDVFHHCRVHLLREKLSRRVVLKLSDPALPLDEEELVKDGKRLYWLPVRMLSATPHASIQFRATPTSSLEEAIFLLDTGAAGTDIIFNSVATGQYGLWPKGLSRAGISVMRGMGAQGNLGNGGAALDSGVSVTTRLMAEVAIAPGLKVRNVGAIVMSPDQANGLQLSSYTAGLICNNLFAGCDLVFDYANNRIGVIVMEGDQRFLQEAALGG